MIAPNAMDSSPLQVNPSKAEIWTKYFETFEKFYKENKHLTLPKDSPEYTKLSQWLTCQRHHAKTFTKKQLARLESIHYMDAQGIREADEKDWLQKLENLYHETGLIRVPPTTLLPYLFKGCLATTVEFLSPT
jgi:hypothetical protein